MAVAVKDVTPFEPGNIDYQENGPAPVLAGACRSYVLGLLGVCLFPLVLYATFIVLVDPYYLFGSPDITGLNRARPSYEPQVVAVKPYQLRRIRPEAVILGSSRAEAGLDPDHPGWRGARVFNFAIPASGAYDVMMAFNHALEVAPIKTAVLGLDFFAYNAYWPAGAQVAEPRFAGNPVGQFLEFLEQQGKLPARGSMTASPSEREWAEALYLALNPDVAAAVKAGRYGSGREHFDLAGRAEGRPNGLIPPDWDEEGYLQAHPDVAYAVGKGMFVNGYHHYVLAGKGEGRLGGFLPNDWNEEAYLRANPEARLFVAQGKMRTGFTHYAALGRAQGRLGGRPVASFGEWLRLTLAGWDRAAFQMREVWSLTFSTKTLAAAVATIRHEAEPPAFAPNGQRIWHGRDEVLQRHGGQGYMFRGMIADPFWYLPPFTHPMWNLWRQGKYRQYCFSTLPSPISTFEFFRFVVQRAYSENMDLKLFLMPLHASARLLNMEMVGDHYDIWRRALVRINEEEATRQGKQPFALWDFSQVNTVTTEPIPADADPTPMHYYWDPSHYKQSAGDLILDRLFGLDARVPADFGVRLTGAGMDAYEARDRETLRAWLDENPDIGRLISSASAKINAAQPNRRCALPSAE